MAAALAGPKAPTWEYLGTHCRGSPFPSDQAAPFHLSGSSLVLFPH